jgi:DNA-binding NtrC family response regulator
MNIVLISGRAGMRRFMENFFGKERDELHCFFDHKVADVYIHAEVPDLIIVDLRVNQTDRLEFVRLAKKNYPGLKAIGMSNFESHRKKFVGSVCDGFLRYSLSEKSFSRGQLEKEIEAVFKDEN